MRRVFSIAVVGMACCAAAASKHPASSLGNAKDEDPEFASLPRSSPPLACPDEDAALARGLLFAFEPGPLEIRVFAIEDLALLGDPRALNALAQLIFDSQQAVQAAAVRAVAQFSAPRAEEILANVIRHPLLPERLKLLALQTMVFQRSPTAREMLAWVAANQAYKPSLRTAAAQALQDWGPTP